MTTPAARHLNQALAEHAYISKPPNMNIEKLIELSEVFLDAPEDDAELVHIVEGKGYDKNFAERFVAFMPLAFGRVVIDQLGTVKVF